MSNEGKAPDLDLKIPSLDLDLPEPSLSFDLSGPGFDLQDLNPGDSLEVPPVAPAPKSAAPASKPADRPPENKQPAKKAPKARTRTSGPKQPKISTGALLPAALNVLSIIILLVIAGIMYLFDIPVNAVPDLTLATYVQGLWLAIGCLFVVAMLEDIKTALILTGIDVAMLATIFPTLWLLLNTPMNPMYFFVMGLIALLAFVMLPLNVLKSRKPAPGKPAPAGAGAPQPAGP